MALRFFLAVAFACASSLRSSSQGNQGAWETPFDHAVPTHWQLGQPEWDGEPLGPYGDVDAPHRFNAAHMALIPVGPHRGKVLAWAWTRAPALGLVPGFMHWAIVDVSGPTPSFANFTINIPTAEGDFFCSGHAWTKDGHLLVAGGDRYVGLATTASWLAYRFDPLAPLGNAMWVREPNMLLRRWYPSVTTLATDANGKDLMLVSSGWGGLANNTFELFDPSLPPGSGQWVTDPGSGFPVFNGPPVACSDWMDFYPRALLLSSGKVFFAGHSELGYRLDLSPLASASSPTWEVQSFPSPATQRNYVAAFLYPGGPLDTVLRVGGQKEFFATCEEEILLPPSASAESCPAGLAANDPGWNWSALPSMASPRAYPNAVLLPDASVLAVTGNGDESLLTTPLPVLQAEVLNDDPSAPHTWRSVASMAVRRGYHGTTLLLPDGRVLVGGGEQREHDYEIFRPHYLTNGTKRPELVGAPDTLAMQYGETYELAYERMRGATVERAVLMAPGSVTHNFDMHQRYVELERVPGGPTQEWKRQSVENATFRFRAPASSKLAPRGYYMLFLVTNVQSGANRRAPSDAVWVHLQ